MSLLRGTWNDGEAITTVELNRPNDVSANADDRVLEALFTPGATQKRLIPLSLSTTDHTLMVVPGGTSGSVALKPCVLVAGHPTTSTAIKMSATLLASLDSNLVGANSSGSTRIDLLYATVSRTTPATIGSPATGVAYTGLGIADVGTGATVSRTVKDVSSGNVSTQSISIYDVPTITLTILAGTPGSGVAPALPSDSGSAYNFSLSKITVANGYTSGTAISASNLTQEWTQATLPVQLVKFQQDVVTSDAPIVTYKDSAGNVRGIRDHVGYRRGRINEWYEDWIAIAPAFGGSIAGAASVSSGRVQYSIPASAQIQVVQTSAMPGTTPVLNLSTANVANASKSWVGSAPQLAMPQTYTSLVCEFEVYFGAASALDWKFGFSSLMSAPSGTPSSSEYAVALCKQSSDTTWQLLTGNGSAFTKTNTGVTPSSTLGSPDRITFELHGSASPYGALARIFINETLVASTTSTLPFGSAGMSFFVVGTATSATNSANVYVGPVRAAWNRYLSIPTI